MKPADLEVEIRGHYTHDRVASAIQSQSFSQHVRSRAKLAAPEPGANHHDGTPAELVFAFFEQTPNHRLHPQHRKKIR